MNKFREETHWMKRVTLTLAFFLAITSTISAQTHPDGMQAMGGERPATLMRGLGSHHHQVSTTNRQAQAFFDQGLTLIYAFNHEEAVRSFKRAAELDPQLAMAYWGMALALGPNINLDVDPEREKAAYEAVQKALALSERGTAPERAYIAALAKRYSIAPDADLKRLAVDYKNAMGELTKQYPDDLDAATLYAESGMDLRPWQLWTKDGKPAEGTEEIVAVLESVLKRNPNHIGAIHYYIHTVEASPSPGRALAYLEKLPSQVPAAGHLVHMPAHIYMRTGDYERAARSNKAAAAADEAFFQLTGTAGMYPVMYYNHNLHFLAIAYSMAGRYREAMRSAQLLEANVRPRVKEMPMLEGFLTTSDLMLVRFRRWDEILKLPETDTAGPATSAVRRFARGMAYAATGKIEQAESELKAFTETRKLIPAEASFGLNSAAQILQIAENVLSAKLAIARRDNTSAIELLKKGVEIEDALAYDEPPAWFLPVRESLGGALLLNKDYAEAEAVFRADLERNPRSGRSLFGLMESLKAQKTKTREAALVGKEFADAWKGAEIKLKAGEL
jgi:tetratricopeptide (TPR) repeat protein